MKDRVFPDPIAAAFGADWRLLMVIFCFMAAIGTLVFLDGISGANVQRAWLAYLINFLFWTGLAYGSILFSAILTLTNARWGRSLKRLAEAFSMFLPFSFAFFVLLYFGRSHIFPWIHEPVPGREWWFNVYSLFKRDGFALFLLMSASLAFVYYSLRQDRNASVGPHIQSHDGIISDGSSGHKNANVSRQWKAQVVLSPIVGILYALVLSLLAIDLIMSLEPHWVSTLFPAYFFMSSFYLALTAITILLIFARKTKGLQEFLTNSHMHDMGKLMLGFCIVTGDFFYSQFLVIWYGNLPEEVRFVLLRVRHSPWQYLAWTVLFACFAMPFIALLSRKIKMTTKPMAIIGCVVIVGMWLERMLLVAPSLWKGRFIPVGLTEIAITAGFFGVMAASLMLFFHIFPLVPRGDPLFREYVELAQNKAEH